MNIMQWSIINHFHILYTVPVKIKLERIQKFRDKHLKKKYLKNQYF